MKNVKSLFTIFLYLVPFDRATALIPVLFHMTFFYFMPYFCH